LDEIFILNKTLEEKLMHIQRFFEKLREEKLLTNLKKCSFVKKELVYLRFFVLGDDLKI
jgi:hypothetical protein